MGAHEVDAVSELRVPIGERKAAMSQLLLEQILRTPLTLVDALLHELEGKTLRQLRVLATRSGACQLSVGRPCQLSGPRA